MKSSIAALTDDDDDMQDLLFRHQACDEIVTRLAVQEEALFTGISAPSELLAWRPNLLHILSGAVKRQAANNDSAWFLALQIFDADYFQCDALPPEQLVARAVASFLNAVSIADSASAKGANKEDLARELKALADVSSQELGFGEVSWEAILQDQLEQLKSGRCRATTVVDWMRVFFVRFDTASNKTHTRELADIQTKALQLVRKHLEVNPLSANLPPRTVAAAACLTALSAAGILPAEPDVLLPEFGADQGPLNRKWSDSSASTIASEDDYNAMASSEFAVGKELLATLGLRQASAVAAPADRVP